MIVDLNGMHPQHLGKYRREIALNLVAFFDAANVKEISFQNLPVYKNQCTGYTRITVQLLNYPVTINL
jgi:hypothetical protein